MHDEDEDDEDDILTAGGRVVVEVQGFHDQRVRPLHTKTERNQQSASRMYLLDTT